MDTWATVFTVLGGIANVAMAAAATVALTLWRKQLAGASHHELAKKLAASLRQVAITRADTIERLRQWQDDDPEHLLTKRLAAGALPDSAEQLRLAVDELAALEGQVAVLWGDEMLDLVEEIRYETRLLVTHAILDLDPEHRKSAVADVLAKPRRVATTFTGGAYAKALEQYTRLAQEFLAMHLARDGARKMSTAELAAKRRLIDEEIKHFNDRLAAPHVRVLASPAHSPTD